MPSPATPRVEVRRAADRGVYDRDVIHGIVDEALYCHIGFVDDGTPFVIPTLHARLDDTLYVHGAPASRMLKAARAGAEVCVTFTLVDGLVLARSAFHHSMNYRSVVVLGVAQEVVDAEEKVTAFRALVEHVASGRWEEVRRPTLKEFNKTQVLALSLEEASAKIRRGPPVDDEEDYGFPVWAGEVPLATTASDPIADPALAPGIAPPAYVAPYRRRGIGGP